MADQIEVKGSVSVAERARQIKSERVVPFPKARTAPTRPAAKAPEPEEIVEPVAIAEPVMVEPEIDYKLELEKEKKAREKAEFTLYKMNKANKENKVEPPEERSEVATEVAAILEEQTRTAAEGILSEELDLLTSNEDERELVRLKYDNALVKTGFTRAQIRQDLEDARFLANKTKYVRQTEELSRAAVSKRTMGNDGQGVNQDKPQANEDPSKHFTKGDWKFMQDNPLVYTKEKVKQLIANRK